MKPAKGKDLELLANNFYIKRAMGETDASLRKRIRFLMALNSGYSYNVGMKISFPEPKLHWWATLLKFLGWRKHE